VQILRHIHVTMPGHVSDDKPNKYEHNFRQKIHHAINSFLMKYQATETSCQCIIFLSISGCDPKAVKVN